MDQSGYIALYRKIKESDLWPRDRPFTELEAWIDLMLSVRWKADPCERSDKHGIYTLNQGEILASERFLAARWDWGKKKVRGYVARLEKLGSIKASERNHKRTILKLVNFKVYQDQGTRQEPDKNQLGTSEEPDRNQTRTKEEEGNKEIREEGKKNTSPKKPKAKKTDPPNEKEWIPTKTTLEAYKKHGYSKMEFFKAITLCFDYYRGKGEKRADWNAVVRNWMSPGKYNNQGMDFKIIANQQHVVDERGVPINEAPEPDFQGGLDEDIEF